MNTTSVRSGGTSLADGAIPVCGGLVLCMDRLNKIIELNEEGMYMTVEAGVRTVDLQNAAKKVGLMYAGDPSSAESCLIGGNLATNAGGLRAVRYGVTRDQVYCLEIVTPTGDIVECGRILKKCSTGYDLEQLIIGSEGTLGIITKVTDGREDDERHGERAHAGAGREADERRHRPDQRRIHGQFLRPRLR